MSLITLNTELLSAPSFPPATILLPPLSLPGYQLAGRHSPDLTSNDLIDLNNHTKIPSGRRSFVGQLRREAVFVYYPFHNWILQEEYNSVHLKISNNDILYHYKSRSWSSFFLCFFLLLSILVFFTNYNFNYIYRVQQWG